MRSLLADWRKGPSDFALDHFVTGSGVTAWGMYQQALHELHNRWYARRELARECSDSMYQPHPWWRRILGRLFVHDYAGREERRMEREYDQAERRLRNYSTLNREIRRFTAQASHLRKVLGPLTDERKEELERDYWMTEIQRKLSLDLHANGRPSRSTLEDLEQIAPGARAVLLESLQSGKVMEFLGGYRGRPELSNGHAHP